MASTFLKRKNITKNQEKVQRGWSNRRIEKAMGGEVGVQYSSK